MGFFGDLIGKTKEDIEKAERRAENWDVEEICEKIQRVSDYKVKIGLNNAVKKKCRNMSDYELRTIYDRAWNEQNKAVLIGLFPSMKERGLAEKDDNGRVHRCY